MVHVQADQHRVLVSQEHPFQRLLDDGTAALDVAVGAGVKLYQGTGAQVAYQPLSNIALLTQQQDLAPLVSAGGGVKFQLSPHLQIRMDVHDYLTPFPKNVITPNMGGKVGGWLQDIVPMIGISYTN